MIHTLWGNSPDVNDALAVWCAKEIGLPRPFQAPYTTMGVFDDSTLIAVILWNNWQPEAGVIEFHGAGITPRWLTRPVLKEMFEFPFRSLECQMVVTRNSATDDRLKRMLMAYGFKHVTIPRLRGRDEDERVFWLTQEAWEGNRFNRKEKTPEAA